VLALATPAVQSQSSGFQFALAEKWSDWMCVGQEVCAVGDFNRDGRDDIVAFVRSSQPGATLGDAWVALSIPNVPGFAQAQKWSDWICVRQEICVVGDFNRDGLDDVAAFVRDTQAGTGRGDVWVALSTGFAFEPAQKWHDFFCIGQEVCSVGDFNRDGRDDLVYFVRSTQTGAGQGDAWVALSTGSGFAPAQKWSDWICVGEEICSVGDFNRDGRDDLIAFVRDTQTGTGRGDAWVAFSTGSSFGAAVKRSDSICLGEEICVVGDFNNDGRDDVGAFVRDAQTGSGRGDVWIALAGPNGFGVAEKWSDYMCVGQEVCTVGDFDGNGMDDAIAFVRGTQAGAGRGDVWVALAFAIIL
jgi:hypothetical protein